ncbi:MAG: CarD family transcriptional regulator [Bdellovibrionales bacterium]|nr:CarD family transcriptional regulator [Bdellovibrionales bacterium]
MKGRKFKKGDKVVYPKHGVGVIADIEEKQIAGTSQHFYQIEFISSNASKNNDMRAMVPLAQAETVGLRKVVDKKTIDQVFSILKDRKAKIGTQTWNRRYREYSQKINTGSVFEIAEVIRDLSVLSINKELSFGEKQMLENAKSLLASEIAIARSRSQDKIMGEISGLFEGSTPRVAVTQ